jgi:hypothetical protein
VKASELIELLGVHPDYEVLIETERLIGPISKVDIDCFAEGEPWVFVIEPDMSEDDDA